MKLELFSLANDENAEKIKDFLIKNNLKFHQIIIDDKKYDISYLKITRSHSISIIRGFIEFSLEQLVEDIKKYKPRLI